MSFRPLRGLRTSTLREGKAAHELAQESLEMIRGLGLTEAAQGGDDRLRGRHLLGSGALAEAGKRVQRRWQGQGGQLLQLRDALRHASGL
jgi:hypothetical protein